MPRLSFSKPRTGNNPHEKKKKQLKNVKTALKFLHWGGGESGQIDGRE